MRRNHYIQSFAVLCLFFCLLAGSGGSDKNSNVAGNIYEYTGEPFSETEGDVFRIVLHEDGTFFYSESPFSSYLGIGEWSVAGDVLTLKDDEAFCGYRKNSFRISGEDLIFVEDGSSNFIYIRVKDGERFVKASPQESLKMQGKA